MAIDLRSGPALRLVDALRESSAVLLELLQTRIELVSHEIEIELKRIRTSLVLLLGTLACVAFAIALLVLLVVAIFWDTHRLAAIGTSAAVLLAAGLGFGVFLRRSLAAAAQPFAATLQELRADRAALGRGDGP